MERSIIPSCLFFGRKHYRCDKNKQIQAFKATYTCGNILPESCYAFSIIQFRYITVINIVGKATLDGSDADNCDCDVHISLRNLRFEVYLNFVAALTLSC